MYFNKFSFNKDLYKPKFSFQPISSITLTSPNANNIPNLLIKFVTPMIQAQLNFDRSIFNFSPQYKPIFWKSYTFITWLGLNDYSILSCFFIRIMSNFLNHKTIFEVLNYDNFIHGSYIKRRNERSDNFLEISFYCVKKIMKQRSNSNRL